MKVTEIAVSRSVRVNTGNYEGTEHFVSMKAEVDELDDAHEATRDLSACVERSLMVQLERSYAVRGKRDMTTAKIGRHHGLTYVKVEKKDG